ncbi:MAG: hypothetical protein KI790_08820 [Cyclobacteriaceae bacterium]|nr:hypothetical protein [Cyclobacteriaceae bacterium HetDA_MAG_MS6]
MKSNIFGLVLLLAVFLLYMIALFVSEWTGAVYASVITLAIWFIWLGRSTDLIRDLSASDNKPFSFSRSQMAYWSFIVIASFMVIYIMQDNNPDNPTEPIQIMNATALALIGISAATTTAGNLIDSGDNTAETTVRHQDEVSEGFLTDILSDGNGISIHRVQSLIFNLVYGLIFIQYVLRFNEMKEFDNNTLILLGISSGTYTLLKVNENKNTNTK